MEYEKKIHIFGEIAAVYLTFKGISSLCLVPTEMLEKTIDDKIAHNVYPNYGHCAPMPIVDAAFAGDGINRNFSAGNYMHTCSTAVGLRLVGQNTEETAEYKKVVTELKDEKGAKAEHTVLWRKDEGFLRISAKIVNEAEKTRILEALPSFQISGISPFTADNETEKLIVTELRNNWSGEGRLHEETAAELCFYDSWSHYGMRGKRIGQKGSMPARGNLPFLAITDMKNGVTWAATIAEGGSWQMEVIHNTNALSLSGGLSDFNESHWRKELKPGESFETNEGYVTVVKGDALAASQKLVKATVNTYMFSANERDLPIVYNEYLVNCGDPTMEKLRALIPQAAALGVKYFVMDAGWYVSMDKGCWEEVGDWVVCNKRFPNGLREYADEVKKYGMVAGIWFEFESVSSESNIYKEHPEYLLTKDGEIICHGNRMFLDFRKKEVVEYLSERVIAQLKDSGIGYLKVDYNENIGVGCDGAESFGEGLRQHLNGVEKFFRKIKEEVPEIVVEMCSSGGMRHTPAWLRHGDMCSFSDAHFGADGVPIAMGLHRFIAMEKLQIWAEMKPEHTIDYFVFTLAKGMLGRICLSGALEQLNEKQKKTLQDGLKFYADCKRIIKYGITTEILDESKDLNRLDGKAFMLRRETDKEMLVYVFMIGVHEPIAVNTDGYVFAEAFGNGIIEISNKKTVVSVGKEYYTGEVLRFKKR